MPRVVRLALIAMVMPLPALAQRVRGEGYYYSYGYTYSPWRGSAWTGLEFRTKCEGEQVKGMNTGPMKWIVEFRNRSKELVTFDYGIAARGPGKPISSLGTIAIKPGKTAAKFAIIPTTGCDEGVLTAINKVRFGKDANNLPYATPDRR